MALPIIHHREHRIFDGHSYHRYREVGNATLLRCQLYREFFCRGQGKIVNNVFQLLKEHNHPRRNNLVLTQNFRDELQEECRRRLTNTRTIYRAVSIRHPDASGLVPFHTVKNNMNRWQRDHHLPEPQSLSIFRALLQLQTYENLLMYERGSLTINFCNTAVNHRDKKAAVITDNSLIRKIGARNNELLDLYVDTNQVLVTPDMGISTIMTWILPHRNYSFPIIWNLINNNNTSIYEVIAENIHDKLIESNINIDTVYYNFNQNLYHSISTTFDNVNIHGLFTSHCLILLTRAKNIEGFEINNRDHQILLKKFICLSWLPSDQIYPAFVELSYNLPIKMKDSNFEEFIKYYGQMWINTVGTNNYSFYQNFDLFCQVSHKNWKKTQSHLNNNFNIWNLCKVLLKWFNSMHKDLNRLEEDNNYVAAARVKIYPSRSKLRRLWTLFNGHFIDRNAFLAVSSNLIDEYFQDLIFNQVTVDSDFELVTLVHLNHNLPEVRFIENDRNFNEIILHDVPNHRPENAPRFGADDICLACAERDPFYRFRPCGHAVLCRNCYEIIVALAEAEEERITCPVCRGHPREAEEI